MALRVNYEQVGSDMDSICNSCDVLKINIVRTASIISFFNRNFDFKVPKLGLTCQAYLVLLSVKSIMWRFCLFRCEFCLPFYCKFSTSFLALQNLRAIRRKISCLTHRSSNKWSGHSQGIIPDIQDLSEFNCGHI